MECRSVAICKISKAEYIYSFEPIVGLGDKVIPWWQAPPF